MSRLTAAQVIAQGDYLQPDFDPASLTVAQLLGVFGFHNVKYPSQYTKPKLVQLFNEEIKTKAKKYTKERIKRENSQASEDGITDGVTGRPLNEGKKPARRTSRRLSKTPAVEEQPDVEASAPPKRRRSSAEPSLGGPSKRKSVKPVVPVLVEESEPEEVPVARKVGRPRKAATDAATQTRRASRQITEDPESGWEDNNVFQSGAESSSPIRPSPAKARARKSLAARPVPKSRKSMSAPPQMASPSPPKNKGKERDRFPSVKPPESSFEPDLPPEVFQQSESTESKSPFRRGLLKPQLSVVQDAPEEDEEEAKVQHVSIPPAPAHPSQMLSSPEPEASEPMVQSEDDDAELVPTQEDDENVFAVSQRIADGGALVKHEDDAPRPHWFLRFLFTAFFLSTVPLLYQYKQESSSIGFCDTGSNTNQVLEGLRAHRAAVQSCNLENRTTLWPLPGPDGTSPVLSPVPTPSVAGETGDVVSANAARSAVELCPAPPLVPFAHPNQCSPCPKHATCTPNSVICENGFILRPHPLLAVLPVPYTHKEAHSALQTYERPSGIDTESDVPRFIYSVLSSALDGLPYFGPVAFPPRCVEDPRRKRHIGVLGKAIESILANERGRRLCDGVGVGVPEGDEATEAQRWGIEVEKLREHIKEMTAPSMLNTLDDTFNEAVQQLLQWGGVFMSEDATGKRYLAHKTPAMSWECSLRVKAREAWSEWQRSVLGTALAILSLVVVRHRRERKVVEDERVAALVTVALECLRNQELAHHTDPVMAPRPYLSSLQLRDLVLQDVHAINERKRLWARVERIVEGNANVRTNLEEVEGGDEQRVWRWVGSAGRTLPPGTPGVKRLADFEERGEGGRVVA
ncbi:Man1-Src1p-C-terminal domain-containing protein [Trametes polyzona]|nr:Man1-Src1p-C-terminal domain-containing protein [Trametes polyzona]